jgi:hypothetical protein
VKHVKLFGACLVAVLAVAGIGTNTALATSKPKPPKPGLWLSVGEVTALAGETSSGAISVDGCLLLTEGTLTVNTKPSDSAAFATPVAAECENAGYAIEGKVESVKLAMAGTMAWKAAITLTVPGPCKYSIKKYSIPFNPNGSETTFGEGELSAKLSPKQPKTCTTKELTKVPFVAALLSREIGEYSTKTT